MSNHVTGKEARIAALAVSVLGSVLASGVAMAGHGTFTLSQGIYRVPFADGLAVTASNDHHNHPNSPDRVDMSAGDGTVIVAAASGIIRGIVDFNGDDFGRDDGLAADGITPQDGALEDNCSGDDDGDNVVGSCSDYNNYVWIEHPNGEWTKYSHPKTGSVTVDYGWSVGDVILAGQPLGLQGKVGAASGSHLHFEVAIPNNPSDLTPFSTLGGFIQGSNVVTQVCFIDGDADDDDLYSDGETYTAGPCPNTAPMADAGGPYVVNEGASIQLDGTGSIDVNESGLFTNDLFSYSWSPAGGLDDAALPMPTFDAIDDGGFDITLTITELSAADADIIPGAELGDDDTTTITVLNVPPTVTAVGDSIVEGGTATVSATFTDPGTLDTHTATIDWDDGTPLEMVGIGDLALGVEHVYGDNGVYDVTVTVIDDDGGAGNDTVTVNVANLSPTLALDISSEVHFPGGDYQVVAAGSELAIGAEGSDSGSDDLSFTWSFGDSSTYFNDGIGPDPAKSPLGSFPFAASDSAGAVYVEPGVELLTVTLSDDDGGSADAGSDVVVTGTAEATKGQGWWKHQFSGKGKSHVAQSTLEGYIEVINAVSSVFSESAVLSSTAEADEILSPSGNNPRGRAEAELLLAWLSFASGSVAWNATVPLGGGETVAFLDLMADAETTILDGTATKADLKAAELALARVRHAH